MMRSRPSHVVSLALLAAVLHGCHSGRGSDIGPNLRNEPTADWRALVLDDEGRPVVGARVTIAGHPFVGATNRNGRASVLGGPAGTRLVTVDGTHGAATGTDRPGSLAIAHAFGGRAELPFVVYLPDLATSTELTVTTGSLPAPATLDDSGGSGAVLELAAGTVVTRGADVAVRLRTASLRDDHVPPGLSPASSPRLVTRGVLVDPVDVSFTPGAQITLPNDIGVGVGQSAALFRLDPATGVWSQVGNGIASATSITAPVGAAVGGGLYAFVVPASATATATLSGRVVDGLNVPVVDALVRAGDAIARTRADGTYVVGPVPRIDASGSGRSAFVTIAGGREMRPLAFRRAVTPSDDFVDLGTDAVPFDRTGNLKVQLVNRAQADAGRRVRVSSVRGGGVGYGVTDARGTVTFEDLQAETPAGILCSREREGHQRIFYTRFVNLLRSGQLQNNQQVFGIESDWWPRRTGNGQTQVQVQDRFGSGSVADAYVIAGAAVDGGLFGITSDFGVVNGGFGTDGQATASVLTSNDGKTVTSATSMLIVDSARIEIPVERAHWRPLGAFDPHGVVYGDLNGSAGPGLTRRIRAARQATLGDWFDDVFFGMPYGTTVPTRLDPAVSGGIAFETGVPTPVGHLSAVEGTVVAGRLAPERFGFALGMQPNGGVAVQRDVELTHAATTNYGVSDALVGLDPTLTFADLDYDLGFRRTDGTVVDVARDLVGFTGAGTSVVFPLPALQGELAGGQFVVAFGAAKDDGTGVVRRQHSLLTLSGGGAPPTPFVQVPRILAPAAGATVSRDGFTVQFELPEPQLYCELRLRSELGDDIRDWTAVIPGDRTSFTFRRLPGNSPQPLAGGRNWTLTLTVFRIRVGALNANPNAYQFLLSNYVGIDAATRNVDGLASITIPLTTTP